MGTEKLPGKFEDLVGAMSDMSEKAYHAGWMHELEYVLWEALLEGPRQYGRAFISESDIAALRTLSRECGGWTRFDDELTHVFVPFDEWKKLFAKWKLESRAKRPS